MSEDWATIAADVVAAIAEVGFAVTITRATAGPTYPGDATAAASATLTCTAVDRKPRTVRTMSGELLTVRSILVAPGSNVPAMGDRLTIRGVDHQAGQVHAIAPGGMDLLHIVELET